MCGFCERFGKMVACSSIVLGAVCGLAAVALRLTHATVLTAGPKSFAAAAALFLLFSIAMSVKKPGCCGPAADVPK